MTPKTPKPRYRWVFFSLTLVLLLAPVAPGPIINGLLLTTVLVASNVVSPVRMWRNTVRLLAIAAFAAYLVGQFWDIQLRLPALIANSVFFAVTMVGIVRHVLRESWAVDSLFGALCVYLLAAVFFGLQYMIISMLMPGSFAGNQSDFDLFYFSVVTLTTVGYGDIQPVAPLAQSIAGIEAIIGQLYLAVLVGWLVGTIKLSANSTELSANAETTQRTSVS